MTAQISQGGILLPKPDDMRGEFHITIEDKAHYVCICRNGGEYRAYIDGALEESTFEQTMSRDTIKIPLDDGEIQVDVRKDEENALDKVLEIMGVEVEECQDLSQSSQIVQTHRLSIHYLQKSSKKSTKPRHTAYQTHGGDRPGQIESIFLNGEVIPSPQGSFEEFAKLLKSVDMRLKLKI